MTLIERGRWITLLGFGLLAGVYVRALAFTPLERFQGPAQKIFYLHVPAAWSAMLAMGLVGLCSILYLIVADPRFDRFAAASAEVGTAFSLVMLTTGPIWAKPIWGTWWTWDSRLTTTFILWLMYGGYLMLRASADETPQVARFAAVLGIVAVLDVPIVIASVRLWRTIHPAVLVTKQGGHGLEDPRMVATLLICLAAFTVLWAWLLMLRFSQLRTHTRIGALAVRLAFAAAAESDGKVIAPG
jgi:heme exporter protein C